MLGLLKLARKGGLPHLQSVIETPGNKDYWAAPRRILMRHLYPIASSGAANDHKNIVAYFCEELGVPVNAVRTEGGLWLMPGIDARAKSAADSKTTPLISAIIKERKDLVLYLLTLSGQDLDLERELSDGETLLHLFVDLRHDWLV